MAVRHRIALFFGVVGLLFLCRIEYRPALTCKTETEDGKPGKACIFKFQLDPDTDKLCIHELDSTDFLKCEDGEAGRDVLPVAVRIPPSHSGPLLLEGIAINTNHLVPPLTPASVHDQASRTRTIVLIPDTGRPMWWNRGWLALKRVRMAWGG